MTDPPGDGVYDAVLAYDAAFVPRYAQRFGEMLLRSLDLPARANVLDVACRTGYPAAQVLDLTRDGRVIALDADSKYLELARARVDGEVGRRIFFKQGSATDLRFSDEIFTNVLGNLIDRATADRGALVAEAARVLRPGGQLVLTMPLRGSFAEVVDLLREVALRHDLARVAERLEQYVATFPTAALWQTEIASRGLSDVTVETREFTLEYRSGAALFADPVVTSAAMSEWRWCAEGAMDPEALLRYVHHAVDTYYQGRTFELTVMAGCATARRA